MWYNMRYLSHVCHQPLTKITERTGEENEQNGGLDGGVCVWIRFCDEDSVQAVQIAG